MIMANANNIKFKQIKSTQFLESINLSIISKLIEDMNAAKNKTMDPILLSTLIYCFRRQHIDANDEENPLPMRIQI